MSLLPSLSPLATAPTAAAKAQPPVQPTFTASDRPGNASAVGGSTAAETTLAASRIPPVLSSRPTNASTTARSGAEGRPSPEMDVEALLAEGEPDVDAAEMLEKVENMRLAAKEALSRIPVPIEAIPKLTGDLETIRSIPEKAAAEPEAEAS